MAKFRGQRSAFGGPGIEPRWTHGGKDGAGTAYATSSRIWFTIWNGVVTETYYPTIDRPQIRDLQFLVSDGKSFFHEEKRHLETHTERPWPDTLAYRVTNTDPEGRYQIDKEIITDPHLPCLLQRIKVMGDAKFISDLHLYVMCAPHLEVCGRGNNGYVVETASRQFLVAERAGTWLALGATAPFRKLSCGYVGQSDGWTDLNGNFQMDWEFDRALDGNIALTGELDLHNGDEFTLGLAFGDSMHSAITTLLQGIAIPFEEQFSRYVDQWTRSRNHTMSLENASGDGGNLYRASIGLLLGHEDKTFPGAFIASLSIPWGEVKGDEDMGGYHLVWTRDMVQSATALLAAGHTETPLRALIYLAASQQDDGGFPQNFWINGQPYWHGIQLDEVAFPILLAWRLHEAKAIGNLDFYPMIKRAASFLILHGPATNQERWEEAAGYSPSTLASNIAALICAASCFRESGDNATAQFVEDYADFLESHVESWTVTTEGTLLPGVKRHYIRIRPVNIDSVCPDEDPNAGMLTLTNCPPGEPWEFPAKEIVDAGFLELVRYGIRKADDPIIVDSLRVVDSVLKVDTPFGPCWRRYNHDGYGQGPHGAPYVGWGVGRAWPLLAGERAHYELAAGRKPVDLIRAIEQFATPTGLLPEQVWDQPDEPEVHMFLGKPTGAAMPLMWAHAEYIKLLRSVHDGKVFDLIPAVADRYLSGNTKRPLLEVWKHNRQPRAVKNAHTLRIQCPEAFLLHWSADEWQTVTDTTSSSTALGIEFADIPISNDQHAPIRFTFLWTETSRWENWDYSVAVG